MEITFLAGIGRVRGRFKSYKSLQGIAASRDGVGSAGAGLYTPCPAGRNLVNLVNSFSVRVRGVGSNPINLYKVSLLRAMD